MRILSLGAGGFIGCHLTQRLLNEGHAVTAVDIEADKASDFIDHPGLTFIRQDIRAPGWSLEPLVRDADLVIDLIAYANPGLYLRIPLDVFQLNFIENLKIAESCVKHSRRLIQFSTCQVYGRTAAGLKNAHLADPEDPIHATFSEDESECILGPVVKHRWIYSCAKQLLERVLHAYGIEQGFNYTIIRPFNFIGPKIDYLPSDTDGVPRVFSYFMEALLRGEPMRLVDGGRHRRCYTAIGDAVECIARIVENPGGVCDRQVFNVGQPANETTIRGLLGESDVRVNCICPGGVATPMVLGMLGVGAEALPGLRDAMSKTQAIRRAGDALDIARTAAWLACDESDYVTGQAIAVDGGEGTGITWSRQALK